MNVVDSLGRLAGMGRAVWAGRQLYREPVLSMLAAAARLYLRDGFSSKEIVAFGLYARQVRTARPVLISKEVSLAKLRRGNPHDLQYKTEDKVVFYRHCATAGLPIPALIGILAPEGGETSDGRRLKGRGDWMRLLADAPPHFVTKDLAGAYSSGFATYERQGDSYVDHDGRRFDADRLVDHLLAQRRCLILQERLFDHPALTRLSGRPTLQSMRMTTLREADGGVRLLYWFQKLVGGASLSDNFLAGTTGNMMAHGDPDRGILRGGQRLSPIGTGLVPVTHHPDTGVALDGFEIPLWEDAVTLVKRAHATLPEFETLGWDVAVTADGPKLLEANAWWDPPSHSPHIMQERDWHGIFGRAAAPRS